MLSGSLLVGAAASLSDHASVHRDAFLRAITLAAKMHGGDSNDVKLLFEDDFATERGGRYAAARLVDQGVDVVIGHFASGAAEAAAAIYARRSIPLLLPAATADHLIDDFQNTFRLCGRDSALAAALLGDIAHHFDFRRLAVFSDGSRHGCLLSAAIFQRLAASAGPRPVDRLEDVDAAIFVGSCENSANFVHETRAANFQGPLFLTDDALHPQIADRIGPEMERTYIYGFAPPSVFPSAASAIDAYRRSWGTEPGCYFLETYAAMQIAFQLAARSDNRTGSALMDVLKAETWHTAIGTLNLAEREGRPSYALWHFKDGSWSPSRMLRDVVHIKQRTQITHQKVAE